MRIDTVPGARSSIARVVGVAATTLLMAQLSVGALAAGAQSPSPAGPRGARLSAFSGTQAEAPGGACQLADPPSTLVDGVDQTRGASWGCQTITTDDPRLSGATTFIWNTDAIDVPGGTLEISAVRQRIENEAGAWEGSLTELQVGSEFHQAAGWLIGEGAYDGLTAYVVATPDGTVRGVIRPDDGFGPPAAFADE